MPYPNNHACMINASLTNVLGTQTRSHKGKKYIVRIGRKKGDTSGSGERSYLYNKSAWTEAEARAHCKVHGGTFEPAAKTQQFDNPDDNPLIPGE